MALANETELRQAYEGERIAAKYIDARFASELHRLLHDQQVRTIQQVMTQTRPKRALEIAPGPGRVLRDLKPSGVLVCLEYNEGMIKCGRSACDGKAAWVRGNGFQLPFAPVFDLVYTYRFVRHFHRKDRERLYAEIRRVLKPGGTFIMDAVNERVARPWREADPEQFPIYDKLYRPDQLHDELTEAGLVPVQIQSVQKRYSWQYRSQVLLGPRANWLNRLVIRALECLPGGHELEWIVTCRRA
jgi:ubiquinone/menaquinone biosynthesis C-methylase UbiE